MFKYYAPAFGLSFILLPLMLIIYQLSIRIYRLLVFLASGFNAKAKFAIRQRKESLLDFYKFSIPDDEELVWFHASSLGEFEQGLPLMTAYKERYPHRKFLVTFFSPSGYLHRKDHPIIDYVAYLPWDHPVEAKKFVDHVAPVEVFFIKYDFWYFMLREINERSIPLYNISARFVKGQAFFKWYGNIYRKMLGFFDQIFVQEKRSLQLLKSIGIDKVSISGDTRFDNVTQQRSQLPEIPLIEKFKAENELLIIGSAWPEDIEVLKDFIVRLPSNFKVLIAPHDIGGANIEKISKLIGRPSKLFSDNDVDGTQFLILNTIGHLFSAYQYADLAFIGGAFGDGLHNILEATAFGVPVVFGHKGLDKFPEAGELLRLQGAFAVKNRTEAKQVMQNLSENKVERKKASDICLKYMESKKGATKVIMDYLKRSDER